MRQSRLQCNSGKTQILLFGNAHKVWSNDWWPVDLGDPPPPTTVAKILGVMFDTALSFQPQILLVAGSRFNPLMLFQEKC